ncbi:MAG: hypothetical protein ACSHYB_05130 [Roseibacillus sp.]
MIRICACGLALLAGLWVGKFVLPAQDGSQNDLSSGGQNLPTKSSKKSESHLSQLIRDSGSNLGEQGETFTQSLDRLYQQAKSPLRADSEASLFLSESSFEDWEAKIAQREVTRLSFLSLLGAHLAEEDPARACKLGFSGPFSFNDAAEYKAFVVPLLTTATANNPQLVLKALQDTRVGSNRSLMAQAFARRWVVADPAEVAQHYSEILELRNDPPKKRHILARDIMRFWVQKDSAEAVEYVSSLPAGTEKTAFEQALEKAIPANQKVD